MRRKKGFFNKKKDLKLSQVGEPLNVKKMLPFYWSTPEYHHTNEITMTDYLDNHLPENFDLTFDDGSLIEIQNKETNQKIVMDTNLSSVKNSVTLL